MQRVRVASVGLGWWGAELASAAARSGSLEVVRCYARTPQTRQRFAEQHGCRAADSLEDVLADPEVEALLVATPHSHHRAMIEAAAAAGKHVFVEKPLTLTLEDGRVAVAAAERAGVVLQVGHHRRRQPTLRRLRRMVDDGAFDVIHQVEATYFVTKYQQPPNSWRADPAETPVGGMTGLGVHMVDNFHYLLGPVARVAAYSKRILGRWAVDDATVIALEFASGPLGYLGTSLVLPRRCDLAVYGTALAAWSEEDGRRFFLQSKDEARRREEPVEEFDELADELAEFARCIRDGGTPETGGAEALEVVAVLQAIIAATESGRSVELSEVR